HRPYPDLDALLAAADEASYDLAIADLDEALAGESPGGPHPDVTPRAAQLALGAAHAKYESTFGHAFVISLDGLPTAEHLDQTLTGLRSRLGNEPDEERVVAAEELRRLARARIARLIGEFQDFDPTDSPYVPV
ncbi:2-oxo-4-hydroxy-4-carboxy-5-ureidoimidazoline decarboxylase, partial [Streptomyces sp. T-3]|nr:2-oxo-4-hydroxy-4-carboxy-5-ureidoimidazoline decarboxylase [Streptomyces sp. T-3]